MINTIHKAKIAEGVRLIIEGMVENAIDADLQHMRRLIDNEIDKRSLIARRKQQEADMIEARKYPPRR